MHSTMGERCRVCLAQDSLISLFVVAQDEIPISQKIMTVAAVTISAEDKLPHSICSACAERLRDCYHFKLVCEKTDATLRSQLSRETSESDPKTFLKNKKRNFENIESTHCGKFSNIARTDRKSRKERQIDEGKSKRLKNNNANSVKNLAKVQIELCSEDDVQIDESKKEFDSLKSVKEEPYGASSAGEDGLFEESVLSEKSLSLDNAQGKIHQKQKPQKEQCFTCGRVMSSRFRLKMHLRTHTGEKPFTCLYCNKSFSLAQNLKVHRRVHTGEKPLRCSTCGKAFAQSAGLVAHVRLHTGETPYRCTLCTAGFRTPGHLQYHIRQHTGEKNFECETCGRAFITRSDLKQHVQTHTGERPHVCCVCGLRLARASHLKRHMAVHDLTLRPRPHACPLCSLTFLLKADLQRHKNTHSNVETESLAGEHFVKDLIPVEGSAAAVSAALQLGEGTAQPPD